VNQQANKATLELYIQSHQPGEQEMKLRLAVLSCLLMAPMTCQAQNQPRVEFFGGYSGEYDVWNGVINGWNASVAVKLFKSIDLVADFAGYYRSSQYNSDTWTMASTERHHTFLFGPRFSYRGRRFTPFAHALIGAMHSGYGSTDTFGSQPSTYASSTNQLCAALGIGVDIKVTHQIAVRVIELDGLGSRDLGHWSGTGRISTGLVLQISKKR